MMPRKHVNYDEVAPVYDQRYAGHQYEGCATSLLALAGQINARRILEVGCGTGHWLTRLQPAVDEVYGLDLSIGMLQQAYKRQGNFYLTCGEASHQPFPNASFDLVFCVNAFHHFENQRVFVGEARRLLRSGGAMAIIGMDPHRGEDRWYVYDYFEGTYATDLHRFPSTKTILNWMQVAGFNHTEWHVAERVIHEYQAQEVLNYPGSPKLRTSQLALLTDSAYANGIERIKIALAEAEASGKTLICETDISLIIAIGRA